MPTIKERITITPDSEKDKNAFMADLSEEQIKDMSRRYNEYKFKNRKKGFG